MPQKKHKTSGQILENVMETLKLSYNDDFVLQLKKELDYLMFKAAELSPDEDLGRYYNTIMLSEILGTAIIDDMVVKENPAHLSK